jgi:hypothetical protein
MDCWIFDIDGVLVEKVPEDAEDYRMRIICAERTRFSDLAKAIGIASTAPIYIFTGRKASEYGGATEDLLYKIFGKSKTEIGVTHIFFYPEEYVHDKAIYIHWKADNILSLLRYTLIPTPVANANGIAVIFDDDHAVLDNIWMGATEKERTELFLYLVKTDKNNVSMTLCNDAFNTNEVIERIKDVD